MNYKFHQHQQTHYFILCIIFYILYVYIYYVIIYKKVHLLVLIELVIQFTMRGMNNMKHKIQVAKTVFISFMGFSVLFC
jgi:hypothetical protein